MPHNKVYLLVVDDTEEFQLALEYAASLARDNFGHIALLYVCEMPEVPQWGDIEKRMRRELYVEGERLLFMASQKLWDLSKTYPVFYLEEGQSRTSVCADVIKRDPGISMLVLASSAQASSPGPLVSYFMGKGHPSLTVPLTIIPGHMELEHQLGEVKE